GIAIGEPVPLGFPEERGGLRVDRADHLVIGVVQRLVPGGVGGVEAFHHALGRTALGLVEAGGQLGVDRILVFGQRRLGRKEEENHGGESLHGRESLSRRAASSTAGAGPVAPPMTRSTGRSSCMLPAGRRVMSSLAISAWR